MPCWSIQNLTDGGPLALVEAQTHGLPVVSYRFFPMDLVPV